MTTIFPTTAPPSRSRRAAGVRLGVGLIAGAGLLNAGAQATAQMPMPVAPPVQSPITPLRPGDSARQVVVVGVEATPGSTAMDPKIAPVVQAQLRKLRPNHGFRLIKVKGERIGAGQSVKCDLDDGFAVQAKLTHPGDPNGKVQLQFNLTLFGESEFQTIVATPPDQFNFFDKALPTGNRLIVGVGAR